MRVLHVHLTKELADRFMFDEDSIAVRIPEITYVDVSGDVNCVVYPGINPVTWASSYDEIVYYDEDLDIQEIVSNKE